MISFHAHRAERRYQKNESLMIEAEMVSETLDCFSELTNLVAREYFIENINVLNIILSLMGMQ
jgi:hypothetical protein